MYSACRTSCSKKGIFNKKATHEASFFPFSRLQNVSFPKVSSQYILEKQINRKFYQESEKNELRPFLLQCTFSLLLMIFWVNLEIKAVKKLVFCSSVSVSFDTISTDIGWRRYDECYCLIKIFRMWHAPSAALTCQEQRHTDQRKQNKLQWRDSKTLFILDFSNAIQNMKAMQCIRGRFCRYENCLISVRTI